MKKNLFLITFFICSLWGVSLFAQTARDFYRDGKKLYKQKEYERAIEEFTSALELNPEYAKAFVFRGLCYASLGMKDEALSDFSSAIEIKPDYEEAYFYRGRLYVYMEEYEKGIADLDVYLNYYPDDSEGYRIRGNGYRDLEDYPKALEDYKKSLEVNEKNLMTYLERASLYIDIRQYQKAINDCTIIIKHEKRFFPAYNMRGYVYHLLKRYPKAVKDFSKALELYPDFEYAYRNRARSYLMMGKTSQAMDDLETALQLMTGNISGWDCRSIATLLMLAGDYERGFHYYELAVSLDPDETYGYFFKLYAAVKVSKKLYDETLEQLASIKDTVENEWERTIIAFLLQEITADRFLAQAEGDAEKLCEAYFYIGLQLLANGEKTEAKKYFKLTLKTKIYNFVEYDLSQVEVKFSK